jgi:hypothetical protein
MHKFDLGDASVQTPNIKGSHTSPGKHVNDMAHFTKRCFHDQDRHQTGQDING